MSPIPLDLYLLFPLLVAQVAAVPWLLRWGRLTPVQAGWRLGWPPIAQGVGWGALLAALGLCWLRYLLQLGEQLPLPLATPPTELEWLLLVLAAPVADELLFRGVIFAALQRRWRLGWALLISAALSTLLHPNEALQALLLLTNIGYALAFRLARSVVAPMLAHAIVAACLLSARQNPAYLPALPGWQLLAVAAAALLLILLGRGAAHGDVDAAPHALHPNSPAL